MINMERQAYEFIAKQMNDPIIEWKVSKWTGKEFPIFQGDKDLLAKISPKVGGKQYDLPLPSLDWKSREIRRLMWRCDRKLYKTKCKITGKDIITFYHPDIEKNIVELNERYKSVDNLDKGRDFDFTKSFNQQFGELISVTRKESVLNVGVLENSTYTHNVGDMKNCYMVFDGGMCEDSFYSVRAASSKNLVDGFEVLNCENIYSCLSVVKSNNVFYSQEVQDSSYCAFLYNCVGCNNCICCTNLVNKEYHIFNQSVSKEQFQETWKSLFDGKLTTLEKYKKQYEELVKKTPKKNLVMTNCENSIGHNIVNCKNVFFCSDMYDVKNYRYSIMIGNYGDVGKCMDIGSRGGNLSSCYDLNCCGSDFNTSNYNCQFGSYLFWGVNSAQYSVNIPRNTEFAFGCCDVFDKKYCILNKQYTKEEYEALVPKIIEHMQKTGERGEFLDTSLAPFPYNDTIANDYYPVRELVYPDGSRKIVSSRGEGVVTILEPEKLISKAILDFGGEEKIKIKWRTKEQEVNIPEGMDFVLAKDLPDDVKDISDNILKKAIICEVSGRPFRIVALELEFYRKHGIPLPRKHPDVRHEERLAKRPERDLYLKKCDKCGVDILSIYPQNNESKIYCESCYNKEIY